MKIYLFKAEDLHIRRIDADVYDGK